MIESSMCNFCKLQRIKQNAKEKGLKVTLLNDARWGMGGQNVYVHPKDIKVNKMEGGENGSRSKYFVSWMMTIPGRCEC